MKAEFGRGRNLIQAEKSVSSNLAESPGPSIHNSTIPCWDQNGQTIKIFPQLVT